MSAASLTNTDGTARYFTAIAENIDWVGYVDWNIRDFHSYETRRGATYNAYLIRDSKNALIDSVKAPFTQELLANIKGLLPLENIHYLVCHHAELDHSGALPELARLLPQAEIVCNAKTRDILCAYYDGAANWKFRLVKSGDTLELGQYSLTFLEIPMVHWPDSMVSYLPQQKLLFSNDAFGQHLACSQRFADEIDQGTLFAEAKTYYANIVMPYGRQVVKTLSAAAALDIQTVAPSHGVVWRKDLDKIFTCYQNWATGVNRSKALIVYDSMWESTARMAAAIYKGVVAGGAEARLIRIRSSHNTELATESLDAAALVCGSSTLNQKMLPAMASALTYLQGLKPQNKIGFAFGSYGWGAKGAQDEVQAALAAMNVELLREPLKCQWKPTAEVLQNCEAAGRELGMKISGK